MNGAQMPNVVEVVFYWQQWITVAAMAMSIMATPLTRHKVVHVLTLVGGFLLLWSGGWYTAGVHPWI